MVFVKALVACEKVACGAPGPGPRQLGLAGPGPGPRQLGPAGPGQFIASSACVLSLASLRLASLETALLAVSPSAHQETLQNR